MEFSTDVLVGLQIAGDVSKLDDGSFERLVRRAISSSTHEIMEDEKSLTKDDDRSPVKLTAFHALITVFVEAAKHGVDVVVLQSVLEDCHFSNERIIIVIKLYQQNKSRIASQLKRISFNLPHIVDVDWKLDYCIKSDIVEKIDQPLYLITLMTEDGDGLEPKPITFNCNVDQLQDLVVKLKDAVKCLERISQR